MPSDPSPEKMASLAKAPVLEDEESQLVMDTGCIEEFLKAENCF